MSIKKILLRAFAVCALLTLTLRVFRANGRSRLRRRISPFATIGRGVAGRAPATPATNVASLNAIDTFLQEQIRRLKIPGLSLAVVEGDKIVHLRGFGHARPGGAAPLPQTPFVLGSTTKSFTALAVMQLVKAGKIELDAPVQCYLPWFRVADPLASAQMTVRHLLNQTSGLPMLLGTNILVDMDQSPNAAERQSRRLATLELTRPVGSAFEYSNLNYNLLGLIIERASGETYADYIQEHIFTPLEMSHSYTALEEAKKHDLAMGHHYWFSFPVAAPNQPIPRGSLAAGQLISCAEDMAHYLIAHLNGGRYKDFQILSEAGIDELHRGAVEFSEMGSTSQYAMGWFVERVGPVEVISHGGNVPDFSSYMALIPEQKKAVVLLLNSDHYGLPFVLMEVGLRVAALLAGQEPAPIRLGFIPWVMRALPLIPLLQIVGATATVRALRRWQRNPQSRPSRGRIWGRYVLLPLVPNLAMSAVPFLFQSGGLLAYMKFFNPDIAWTARVCGGFAGIWSLVRTGLLLRALQER